MRVDVPEVVESLVSLRGVGQDHVRRYFADSARRNVHESAFIKDRGISGDTEEMVYTL